MVQNLLGPVQIFLGVVQAGLEKNQAGAIWRTLGQAGAPGTQCLVHDVRLAWRILGAQETWIAESVLIVG